MSLLVPLFFHSCSCCALGIFHALHFCVREFEECTD